MIINVIQPTATIMAVMPDRPIEFLEGCGRTCYKSEDRITEGSAEKFVGKICRDRHESVLQHASMTVRFVCSRAASHQLVRHRIGSYSQESQRYVNYKQKGYQVICPPSWGIPLGSYEMWEFGGYDGHGWLPSSLSPLNEDVNRRLGFLAYAFEAHEADLTGPDKSKPEDARYFLPNASKTEIVATYNFRTWRHVFRERALNSHAQWEIREMMVGLYADMAARFPSVFGDL